MQLAKVSDARFCYFVFYGRKFKFLDNGVLNLLVKFKKKILIWLYDTLGLKKNNNKTNFNPLKPYDAKKILPTPALPPS